MTARTVTVQVPGPTGGTVPVTRTFYDTHFGPVVVVPGTFDWTAGTAYAITDVNATNNRAFDGWLQMGRAETVRDLKPVLDRYQFLPWVNVIAADARGEALYADHSVVPRVTDDLAAACIPAPFQPLYASSGQAVLDGSRSACALGADPDAAVPGILGPAHLPVRFRADYVTNSNDSYWLANPQAAAGGLPADHRRRAHPAQPAYPARPDPGAAAPRRHRRAARPRVHRRPALADRLRQPGVRRGAGPRRPGRALHRPAHRHRIGRRDRRPDARPAPHWPGWDLHADLDSRGAHLFREFALANGLRFADPFAVTDPVNTPRRLAVADPRVLHRARRRRAAARRHPARRPSRRHPDRAARRPSASRSTADAHEAGAFNMIISSRWCPASAIRRSCTARRS